MFFFLFWTVKWAQIKYLQKFINIFLFGFLNAENYIGKVLRKTKQKGIRRDGNAKTENSDDTTWRNIKLYWRKKGRSKNNNFPEVELDKVILMKSEWEIVKL